jgi:hypothetical protein
VPLPHFPVDLSSHSHCYKLSRSKVAGRGCHSCLLRPACLFTVPWGIALTPLFGTQGTCPLCYRSFCCCCCLFRFFSLFSLGVDWSVQGATLIWPRVVCGNTVCSLAHLVVCFSLLVRSWCLAVWESSWFLHSSWSEGAMHGLGVWRCQSFALLGGSSWKVHLQHLSKIVL